MRYLLAILFLCVSTLGQGLTLTDFVFIAGGTASSGGGGGGGTAPGPTEYWDFQEASGNRIGEVLGTVLAPVGGSIGNTASGVYGNAAEWNAAQGFEADLPAYATNQSFTITYWMQRVTNTGKRAMEMRFEGGSGLGDWVAIRQHNGVTYADGWQAYIDTEDFPGSDEVTVTDAQTTAWVMLTMVWHADTGLLDLYTDGALRGSTTTPITIGPAAAAFLEIANTGSSIETTRMDELYYKLGTALTADQIDWQFNGGAGRQYSDY